jgi:uncharacterized protein (DUF362 family)/Pyruvate/2-oxoacid:ferredoxin oxidoreductase delta subunit
LKTVARVTLRRCPSYDPIEVAARVKDVIRDTLGRRGEDFGGKRVLVKPNLLAARDPARAVTTHPAVVGGVIDYFKARGAMVSVGDSPGGAVRGVERVWENTGMADLSRSKGVNLVNFEAAGWVEKPVGGREYAIAAVLDDFDLIVNVAKFKTHVLTLLTGAIKNTFGCVPGFHKSALHLKHPRPGPMSRAIVDVFSLVRPRISIMDAVESMDGNGPSSGRVVKTGVLGASMDAVALDAVFADLAGVPPSRVPVISEAGRRGLGEAALDRIETLGGTLEGLGWEGFEVPSNWAFNLIPGALGSAMARFLWVRPRILEETCTGCRLCSDMCPADAISFEQGTGLVDPERCRSCLCCHEACPEGAVEVRMSRLAKLVS